MAGIIDLLNQIKSARYGEQVRTAIHDAIKTCYDDGRAGAIDLQARADITTLQGKTGDATTTDKGIVKLSSSNAVTDSTGLALPVTEKNPTIAGTLAKQISDITTAMNKIGKGAIANKASDTPFTSTSQEDLIPMANVYENDIGATIDATGLTIGEAGYYSIEVMLNIVPTTAQTNTYIVRATPSGGTAFALIEETKSLPTGTIFTNISRGCVYLAKNAKITVSAWHAGAITAKAGSFIEVRRIK